MRILFDTGIPRALANFLSPHHVSTTQKQGWKDLRNGDLLRVAQGYFDVLITTDSNIKYQQRIEQFDIALIVLRAEKTSKDNCCLYRRIFWRRSLLSSRENAFIFTLTKYLGIKTVAKVSREFECLLIPTLILTFPATTPTARRWSRARANPASR